MVDILSILNGNQQQGLGDFFAGLKKKRRKRGKEYDSLLETLLSQGNQRPRAGLEGGGGGANMAARASSNEELAAAIEQAADRYSLPPEAKQYLYAIADIESGFGQNVVGQETQYGKALGPFQFIPPTAEAYGLSDPFDPYQSADAAARHLIDSYQKQGDWHRAAIGHHSGPAWESLGKWGEDYDRKLRERVG